jgi:hypothetical protein
MPTPSRRLVLAALLPLLLAAPLIALPAETASAATYLIQSGDDTSPYSFIPSLPRGNRDTLYAFTDEDESGIAHDFETYVRMDLPDELIGEGDQVTEAYLWVYYGFDFTGFGDGTDEPADMQLHEVLEPWDEQSMDWNSRPAYGPVLDVHPDIDGLGLIWFDVTELVRDWLDGVPNHGVALTNPTPRLIGMYAFEADVEPELKPNLVITTVPEPGGGLLGAGALATLACLARRRRRRRAAPPDLHPRIRPDFPLAGESP